MRKRGKGYAVRCAGERCNTFILLTYEALFDPDVRQRTLRDQGCTLGPANSTGFRPLRCRVCSALPVKVTVVAVRS